MSLLLTVPFSLHNKSLAAVTAVTRPRWRSLRQSEIKSTINDSKLLSRAIILFKNASSAARSSSWNSPVVTNYSGNLSRKFILEKFSCKLFWKMSGKRKTVTTKRRGSVNEPRGNIARGCPRRWNLRRRCNELISEVSNPPLYCPPAYRASASFPI